MTPHGTPAGANSSTAGLTSRHGLFGLVFLGIMSAICGSYWDSAWHTTKGLDTFLSPPHGLVYLGVTLIATGLVGFVYTETRESSLRDALAKPQVRLAVLGAGMTFISAPFDAMWHFTFGRDAVVWSPPHMLAITAIFVLAVAVLLEVREIPGRLGLALQLAASGGVFGPLIFMLTEYETDVPQFDEMWYLPVLSTVCVMAFELIRAIVPRRFAATGAALAYTALRLLVLVFLVVIDLPWPAIPVLVVPALVYDFAANRGWPAPARAALTVVAFYAAYVPAFNWLGGGVEIDATDVALGLPVALAGTWGILAVVGAAGIRPAQLARAGVLAAIPVLLLVLPASALAHDPGQGERVGKTRLVAEVGADGATTLSGLVTSYKRGDCAQVGTRGITARRAGRVVEGTLTSAGGCRFEGSVTLPDRGRWFVYADLKEPGKKLETWLPVIVDGTDATFTRTNRQMYVPIGGGIHLSQIIAGVALYGGVLFLLVTVARLTARTLRRPPSPAARDTGPEPPRGEGPGGNDAEPSPARAPAREERDDREPAPVG